MKKTLAALGATVLGLTGAVGAAAAPASAVVPAPYPVDKCTSASADHQVNPDVAATDSWYMTCIPQYGMGKAEFSITAPVGGFPSGYSLTDGHQTVVSSSPTAAQVESYFGDFYAEAHDTTPVYTGAFVNLTQDTAATTDSTQVYDAFGDDNFNSPMTAAFPISSVAAVTTGLPAACSPDGETYQGEYVVNYAPVTTSFSETIGSNVYKTTVTLTAPSLYLGLNFLSTGPFGFDPDKALCATSSGGTIFAPSIASPGAPASLSVAPTAAEEARMKAADLPTGSDAWYTVAFDSATNDPESLTTLVPTTSAFFDPTPIANGAFVVVADPTLATTGVDATPAGILGGSMLLAGLGVYRFGRRRRAAISRP